MVWGYHLRDYGWTPLSQNPARICDDSFRSFCVGRQRYETCSRSQPQSKVFAVLPISADGGLLDIHPMRRGGVKSFVDDLVLGRGVVISRAATSLRSVETQPLTRRFVRSQTNNISSQLVNGLWAFSSARTHTLYSDFTRPPSPSFSISKGESLAFPVFFRRHLNGCCRLVCRLATGPGLYFKPLSLACYLPGDAPRLHRPFRWLWNLTLKKLCHDSNGVFWFRLRHSTVPLGHQIFWNTTIKQAHTSPNMPIATASRNSQANKS